MIDAADIEDNKPASASVDAATPTLPLLGNYASRKSNLVSMKVEQSRLIEGETRLSAPVPGTMPLAVSYADPAGLIKNPTALSGFSNAIQPAGGLGSRDDMAWVAFMKQDLQTDARYNREVLHSKQQSPEAKAEAKLALAGDRQQFQQLNTAIFSP